MYNFDHIVQMYFDAVAIPAILNGTIQYNEFPVKTFMQLSKAYISRNSDTENSRLYEYAQDSLNTEGHPFAAMENRSGLNIFAALEELAEQILTTENDQIVCIYGKLLRFREMTRYVEEDLLVCSYLAMRYKRFRKEHENFAWNIAIPHNNVQLRRIVEKGISENHFHLYGSAASFHLIWMELMNRVGYGNMLVGLSKEFTERQRVVRAHYSVDYSEEPFASRVLKAALLRVCIMRYCIGWKMEGEEEQLVKEILSGEVETQIYLRDIQGLIDGLKMWVFIECGKEDVDYALYRADTVGSITSEYTWVAGERWLMYQMLKKELTDCGTPNIYFQWFYAYLAIKQNIRRELVQINDAVGFENFNVYNRRKNVFRNYGKMIESAVYGSAEGGNIKSLEIRVSPGKNAEDTAKNIRYIDDIIQNEERPFNFPLSSYYFVIHFTKCKDGGGLEDREIFDERHCRHYTKRRELEKQANDIAYFREVYRRTASRVLGIDACSQEIGCRPEVFAVVFRFLREHIVSDIIGADHVSQLRITYHVGEDFLDVIDGLRAVDEAVHFLNLRCGDRIGHGTVLGIDVRKWYRFKQNTILISQQDYLDNIVWLYYKLTEYNICGFDILKDELLKKFDHYFSLIYRNSERENYIQENIQTYFEAWKLRGDEPELYLEKQFDKWDVYSMEWLVNRKYPEKYGNREREEVSHLYYLYHYKWEVRKEGEKNVQIYIPPMYVEAAAAVQKAMQKDIAARGIGIETNPSSNVAISPIQGYEEHPIIRMYNKGLTWNINELEGCPQMNVSINTDDKGVFHTSLENEYALMACALESVKDEEGKPVYNRQMIYQWIDNVREMGNMQTFKDSRRF